METFLELVYNIDGIEYVDEYDDYDEAKEDALSYQQEGADYVILREVTTDYANEESVVIIDEWYKEEE